jgi:translation initiation factor IF-2
VNGYEFTPSPERTPETQAAPSGGPPDLPPRPPKLTASDLLDPRGDDKTIFVAGYIEVRELGEAMKLKPFKVVADLMELKIFKHTDELIDFATAAKIAQKHGYEVKGIL